jgi:hypothetical protein
MHGQAIIFDSKEIPPPLCGDEPGSFAEDTLSRRLPDIARRVLEDEDWPLEGRARLQALIDEMPHGRIRPIMDEGAPDLGLWEDWLPPFLGQTWLDAPWFAAEVYFFRRVLEATGYFRPGRGQGVDPYRRQKLEGLKGVLDQLRPLCAALEGAPGQGASQGATAGPTVVGPTVVGLLHSVIWGNQADLSVWPVDGDQPANHSGDQRLAHLLADDSQAFADFLAQAGDGLPRVDFILDNVGLELAYDLLLADFLLGSGKTRTVRFYVKPFPTYVSDATAADVLALAAHIAGAEDETLRRLGTRLHGCLDEQRLELHTDLYWVSPLAGWEMPPETRREIGRAGLLVSKGDANYRRWLGDRHWPFTTPIDEILAYSPAPLLLLRVLKSEIVAGLKPRQAEEMDQKDPEWLFNGSWGVIQFVP